MVRGFFKLCWEYFLLILDWMVAQVSRRAFSPAEIKQNKEQVLVIRLDAIGDFVLWLNAATALRQRYPRERYSITLLGNQVWASWAKELLLFDQVWPLERRQFYFHPGYRARLISKVCRTSFTIAIQPTYSREMMLGDAVIRSSGAKERIGWARDSRQNRSGHTRRADQWYTRLIPAQPQQLMELERNAEFMRGLGVSDFRADLPVVPIGRSVLQESSGRDYYVLFPGASKPGKQWPLSRFNQLAQRIYQATGWLGVICGSPDEESLGRQLTESGSVPLLNLAGQTSLSELVGTLAGARLLVSNDTSAVHFAAAVRTPVICIVGGGQFGRFIPYKLEVGINQPLPVAVSHQMDCFGCDWHCIYQAPAGEAVPCIGQVTVDAVWAAVEAILTSSSELPATRSCLLPGAH